MPENSKTRRSNLKLENITQIMARKTETLNNKRALRRLIQSNFYLYKH